MQKPDIDSMMRRIAEAEGDLACFRDGSLVINGDSPDLAAARAQLRKAITNLGSALFALDGSDVQIRAPAASR